MKAAHRGSKTTKGWGKKAPKTVKARRALLARCGRKAFLMPDKLKFPVMAASGPCVPDCAGLRVAYARARQYHHNKAAKKAKTMAGRDACAWA